MTLTSRLSLFFLTTLGAVLVGFSAVLYVLASVHLHRQLDERLEAAINTLSAAADIAPDGVEWEPAERLLTIGSTAVSDPIVWSVCDDQGHVVDHSAQTPDGKAWLPWQWTEWPDSEPGDSWQFRRARLASATQALPPHHGKEERKYRELSIVAGVSLEPVAASLRRLASVLVGLSLTIWLAALFVGRAVCRRALLPVRRMADSARDMDADDLGRRLPEVHSGDELENLSRAFNNLLDRLQESWERQQRFTGDASHQLRTPLTALLGQIEVALRRERPGEEYRQVLARVQQQGEHLRRIVESLLFLARADAEAHLPNRERLNLKDWLPAQLRSWADHPRALDFVEDSHGVESAWVEAPPVLLGELVNILVDNACKYSPAGTSITIGLRPLGRNVELLVQDQGAGISADDWPHIFRPFFRSADSRRRGIEGLGLGLAIARRLAQAVGGELTATSRPGQFSCFTLRLPAVEPPGVEPATSVSERCDAATGQSSRHAPRDETPSRGA